MINFAFVLSIGDIAKVEADLEMLSKQKYFTTKVSLLPL